jgi:hyperosmotically inducible protein
MLMKLKALLITAAAGAALTALTACDRPADRTSATTPPPTSQTPATPPRTAERGPGQVIDDAGITAKVKSALLAEQGVNGTAIDVDTMQGNVTLTGRVPDQSQAERAVQVARGIEGVKAVDSKLSVGAS